MLTPLSTPWKQQQPQQQQQQRISFLYNCTELELVMGKPRERESERSLNRSCWNNIQRSSCRLSAPLHMHLKSYRFSHLVIKLPLNGPTVAYCLGRRLPVGSAYQISQRWGAARRRQIGGRGERLAISCLNGVVKLFSEIESSACCAMCVCVCVALALELHFT